MTEVTVHVVTRRGEVIGAAATHAGAQRILETEAQAQLRQFLLGMVFSDAEEMSKLKVVVSYYRGQMRIQPVAVTGLELVDD